MSIIAWIVIGLIAGWLAGLVMGGHGYGFWRDMLLGIVGALVGGFLARLIFGVNDALTGLNVSTLIVSFIGAVVVVAIYRAVRREPVR